MAGYLKAVELDDAAQQMKASVDEAKQADQQQTDLAVQLIVA